MAQHQTPKECGKFREQQHFLVTIEDPGGADNWLDDDALTVSLKVVRQALAKVSTTLARAVDAEREERGPDKARMAVQFNSTSAPETLG